MAYQVLHYRQKCIGCHACVEVNQPRWRISQRDGKSILLGGKVKKGIFMTSIEAAELPEMLAAVEHCPVGIIQVQVQSKKNLIGTKNKIP